MRSSKKLQTRITRVAPYSISVNIIGGLVVPLIRRGEELPAIGEETFVTAKDNQRAVRFQIFQGEHVLMELNDCVGSVTLSGIPPRPRWQARIACTIEYNENGMLVFSARETQTNKVVEAKFRAKTAFTDADRARLEHVSEMSQDQEGIVADRRYFRANMMLDIVRAETRIWNEPYQKAAQTWREWVTTHEDAQPSVFREKSAESQMAFYKINPAFWRHPWGVQPNMQFRPIWPLAPSFTREGGAVIRFSVRANYRNVRAIIQNMTTKKVTKQTETCQTLRDGRVETFMRITYPENGRYKVKLSIATPAGKWFHARERVHTDMVWRFDVSGAPSGDRPISQLMRETRFAQLSFPDTLLISRDSSCIRIRDLAHEFTCVFRGELAIEGRERDGQPRMVTHLNAARVLEADGWKYRQCRLKYPGPGTWRALFSIDGQLVATQTVVTAFEDSLPLTDEEKRAFAAGKPDAPTPFHLPALF
jgi:hypothetical protein